MYIQFFYNEKKREKRKSIITEYNFFLISNILCVCVCARARACCVCVRVRVRVRVRVDSDI